MTGFILKAALLGGFFYVFTLLPHDAPPAETTKRSNQYRCVSRNLLITTYTNENVDQINAVLIEKAGCVPPNITVLSWFSFLLQDGVRPYQNHLASGWRVETINFLTWPIIGVAKANVRPYYFDKAGNILADRVSEFIVECNTRSGGRIISRIERIYSHIFIDEMQDMAGYDFEFLEALLRSKINVVGVCDPRQGTFSTNRGAKNKKFKRDGISDWIGKCEAAKLVIVEPRVECYRSNQAICDFSDALFPHLPKSVSKNVAVTGHDGVFPIASKEALQYHEKWHPVVLRYSRKTDTMGLDAFNIGKMKGRSFDRVLIFTTGPMKKYFKTKIPEDASDLSKFYVALTRARYSVALVV